jgi:hypothetical protein
MNLAGTEWPASRSCRFIPAGYEADWAQQPLCIRKELIPLLGYLLMTA